MQPKQSYFTKKSEIGLFFVEISCKIEVVHHENRNLAGDSTQAANNIARIIADIDLDNQEAVKVMQELNTIGAQQNEASLEVTDATGKIFADVHSISQQINTVFKELESVGSSKEEIIFAMESILAVTEETASMVEEVNGSVDLQAESMTELKKKADELMEMSLKLNENVNIFRVLED